MKLKYVTPKRLLYFNGLQCVVTADRTLQGKRRFLMTFPVHFDALLHNQSMRFNNDDNSHGLIRDIISGITEKSHWKARRVSDPMLLTFGTSLGTVARQVFPWRTGLSKAHFSNKVFFLLSSVRLDLC
jgi:hypothetical protein